jgi:RND family efflux transporter MFP subunit
LSKEVDNFYSSNPIIDKIENVKSNIAFQEKEVEKMKKLYEGDAVSKSELDKVIHQVDSLKIQLEEVKSTADSTYNQLVHEKNMTSSQLDELEANLKEIELSLENTEIKAPYQGLISQVLIEEGELAMPNKPAVKISSTEKQKIVVNLSEVDLKKIENNIDVEYRVGGEDQIRKGKVTFISSNVNPVSRVGTVEIAIDSSNTYSPGSSVEVNFILFSQKDQILIPASSVKDLNEKNVVYIHEDGFVYEKEVELGIKNGNMYQILSGLEEGQTIASNNLDSLYDGTPVYTFDKEDI